MLDAKGNGEEEEKKNVHNNSFRPRLTCLTYQEFRHRNDMSCSFRDAFAN